MIYIKLLHIENYKCFRKIDIEFNKDMNIVVGNNEAGKSTILEAINLCLSCLVNGRYLRNELNEYFFNSGIAEEYKKGTLSTPPNILIEVYFESDGFEPNKNLELLQGTRNSRKKDSAGVKLEILFDEKYNEEYGEFKSINENKNIPIEYYKIEWKSFADTEITARSIPVKPNTIDSSSIKYKNGGDYYISRIINNSLDKQEQIALMQAFRDLKESFKDGKALKAINKKIEEDSRISDKSVSISVNTTEINAWENILTTYFDDIPFTQIGQGEQSIIKTHLSLSNIRKDIFNIVLIEEPENHLSHTHLNSLLNSIKEKNSDRQVIITTHSSFVANKLGLNYLLFLNKQKISSFTNIGTDTQDYFKKLAGYETLRLILSDKAILVEGPSDELIIQKSYMVKHNGHLPIEDGIDVISVKGIQARRFLELAKDLPIKIAVVTDNDGDYQKNIIERYKNYVKDTVKVFSNVNNSQNTLEPSFASCNDEQMLKTFFNYNGEKSISDYMQTCKSDWAYKVFSSNKTFNYPEYINKALD